jgi:hypothetical protein
VPVPVAPPPEVLPVPVPLPLAPALPEPLPVAPLPEFIPRSRSDPRLLSRYPAARASLSLRLPLALLLLAVLSFRLALWFALLLALRLSLAAPLFDPEALPAVVSVDWQPSNARPSPVARASFIRRVMKSSSHQCDGKKVKVRPGSAVTNVAVPSSQRRNASQQILFPTSLTRMVPAEFRRFPRILRWQVRDPSQKPQSRWHDP